jgi:hypothetical protein
MSLSLRPHHVLCSIGFQGHGYSDAFTANMTRVVVGILRAPRGDETRIRITTSADTICAPCPKRRGLGCAGQDRVDRLDRAHGAALGLSNGDVLSWGEAQDRVRRNVAPEDLTTLCAGCPWLESGMCQKAVAQLLDAGAELAVG